MIFFSWRICLLFGNGGRETCEAIRDCAREFASAGMAADARLMLERVEPAVLLSAGAQSPEMEDLLEIRAEILSREGSSGQSTKALREWLDLGVLLHGASSRKAAEAHMSIARHYAELGRRPEAHTSWLDAIKISRTASAGYGAEHAQVMSAASDYFAAQREFDLALACNGEALHAAAFDPDQRKKLESRRTQLLAARERQ
jgi:hypothetical protein